MVHNLMLIYVDSLEIATAGTSHHSVSLLLCCRFVCRHARWATLTDAPTTRNLQLHTYFDSCQVQLGGLVVRQTVAHNLNNHTPCQSAALRLNPWQD